jgi:hypothetical protein
MKPSFRLSFLLFILSVSTLYGQDPQQNVMDPPPETDSIKYRHGPGVPVFGLILVETFFVATSSYAAHPRSHGDEVMGWYYATVSAAILVATPFYLAGDEAKWGSKKDRAWNSIMMLGMSYGFSRLATYNLLHADGDASNTRFTRNLIEVHAAYLVPMIVTALGRSLVYKKKNKSNVETSLMFDGRSFTFAMRF